MQSIGVKQELRQRRQSQNKNSIMPRGLAPR